MGEAYLYAVILTIKDHISWKLKKTTEGGADYCSSCFVMLL